MTSYSSWIEQKKQLALDLENGACGGGYSDGALILCTCISAMASRFWIESRRHDHKRFVELLAKFSTPENDTKRISVPLLIQDCREWRQRVSITGIAFRVTEDDDKTEHELLALCQTPTDLDSKTLREHSYASILYREIRCGVAHSYIPRDNARIDDPINVIFDSAPKVSYVNRMHNNMRQIYFPICWIAAVATSVACRMDEECAKVRKQIGDNLGLPFPVQWWIDG